MSCPLIESKLLAPIAAESSINVTSAIVTDITATSSDASAATNNTNNLMTYPYKKRVRNEFVKRQREIDEEERRLLLIAQAGQQWQSNKGQRLESRRWQELQFQQIGQLQEEQQQHFQQEQQHEKQPPKKQQQKYKPQPGTSGVVTAGDVITASGNILDEVETNGISRPELPFAGVPHQQLHDDESDVAEEEVESSSDDSESSGDTNWSELEQVAVAAKVCCCLATVTGGKALACGRPAFGIWFSNKLRQMALKKNLPFAYNKTRGHWYTCLFHYRIITHEPKLKSNENYETRNLTKYLSLEVTEDEYHSFKNDPLTRSYMKDYQQLMATRETQRKKKRKKGRPGASGGDAETSDDETPRIGSLTGIWPFMSTNFHTMIPEEEVSDSLSGQGCSSPLQVPFHALSATTLRRYKKYFNLPHRSSTNTKQQLLDGILDHFETIDAPAFETVAHFLHIAKTHRNKLDYPSADL